MESVNSYDDGGSRRIVGKEKEQRKKSGRRG